jgi:3-oxoacyl-[acyl-carrier protein] reductase
MEPKVALVTGAARGIGRAIAERLGQSGYHLVAADVLRDVLEQTIADFGKQGLKATALHIDLASPQEISGIPAKLGPLFDKTSVLVNNAGISLKRNGKMVPVTEITLEEWEKTLRVNLTAPFLLSKLVLPVMRRNGWGRIVNISSKAGRTPSGVPSLDYTTTKTALLGLTRGIAKEVAGDNITVNSVAPGRIKTVLGENTAPDVMARILSLIPVNRIGQPEEVAALVNFLVSPEAGFITGAVIDINGGALMI